jgi:hypothetical protein
MYEETTGKEVKELVSSSFEIMTKIADKISDDFEVMKETEDEIESYFTKIIYDLIFIYGGQKLNEEL